MSHQHDYQTRLITKHPGSKSRRPHLGGAGVGLRCARRYFPAATGEVIATNDKGAFQVRYDAGTPYAGRSFWYHSYLAHTFILLQETDSP